MVRRFYDLPPLTGLAVFEASARHGSFKLAAAELNVTPGAVSRQIKSIEDYLGVPLFVRGPGGVELTSAGEDLYAVLSSGFSRAAEVVRTIKRGDRMRNVTIACSDAFATLWLMPRMGDFWRRFPEIAVDHLISDNALDYRRAEVELRIRYGFGSWTDESSQLLFDETIYPVCGQQFAAEHAESTASDIVRLPLLHVDWVDPDWAGWDEVLRRASILHGPLGGRRFGKFAVALQAAQDNQGVAVGWDRLVRPIIEGGKLVRFTDLQLAAPGGYYLTWNDNRSLSPAARTLRDWLFDTTRSETSKAS
jgi:LysR family transcriptional regulator, glycine cleavage system transcriptional activator